MRVKDRESRLALLSVVPALVVFAAFVYYPLVETIRYSVTDWNGYSKVYHYVGLHNFIEILTRKDYLIPLGNTIYFAALSIIVGTVVQLALAVILHEKARGSNLAKTIIYIPSVISPIIVGLTWSSFLQYNGLLNKGMRSIGLSRFVVDWLGDPSVVKNTLVLLNTWQFAGVGMVIFLAGLNSIPAHINESSALDGATGFTKFRRITLPLIMPSVTIVMFLGITGALKVFDIPFILTQGGPVNASQMVTMSIYDNAFRFEKFGLSSAMGVVFFLLIAAITLVQLQVTRKKEVEY